MINEAIILAGGRGTRLKGVVNDLPKSMAPVNGRPFLEYQLDYLDKWGIKNLVISVGYKKELIKEHFGAQYKSIEIVYADEDEPLGTGGGVRNAFQHIEGIAAFIFNGDTYFDINLQRLHDFRRIKEAEVSIILRFENDVGRYGRVEFDEEHRITNFEEKSGNAAEGYINGGVYLMSKPYFMGFDLPEAFSLERDFLQKYCKTEYFFGLRCFSYFRDIGIPEDYQKAQNEFKRFIY